MLEVIVTFVGGVIAAFFFGTVTANNRRKRRQADADLEGIGAAHKAAGSVDRSNAVGILRQAGHVR